MTMKNGNFKLVNCEYLEVFQIKFVGHYFFSITWIWVTLTKAQTQIEEHMTSWLSGGFGCNMNGTIGKRSFGFGADFVALSPNQSSH